MPYLHRNSQKRIYRQGAQYFVTSATFDRYPYFKNPILAELFIRDLSYAKELKEFELFGYAVMPDHVHLLFEPRGNANYSEIMGSIKRNAARDINDILHNRGVIRNLQAGDDSNRRLRTNFEKARAGNPLLLFELYSEHFSALQRLKDRYWGGNEPRATIPTFRWEKSFRDHLIRGHRDFLNHLQYILNNAIRHGIVSDSTEYPFVWTRGIQESFVSD